MTQDGVGQYCPAPFFCHIAMFYSFRCFRLFLQFGADVPPNTLGAFLAQTDVKHNFYVLGQILSAKPDVTHQ